MNILLENGGDWNVRILLYLKKQKQKVPFSTILRYNKTLI